jgi:hypothetical protein
MQHHYRPNLEKLYQHDIRPADANPNPIPVTH